MQVLECDVEIVLNGIPQFRLTVLRQGGERIAVVLNALLQIPDAGSLLAKIDVSLAEFVLHRGPLERLLVGLDDLEEIVVGVNRLVQVVGVRSVIAKFLESVPESLFGFCPRYRVTARA